MGPWGALIMGFFGGVFFVATSVMTGDWNNPYLLLPVVVFEVIAVIALRMIRRAPSGFFTTKPRAGRIIAAASAAQGAGIPVVALALTNTGHSDLVVPGIALVVGLHFLPMAYAIPFRPFYILAVLLLLGAATGMLVHQPAGSVIAGIGASGVLWVASALALARKPESVI